MVSEQFPWHKWEFFFSLIFNQKKRGQNWAITFRSISETSCVDSREIGCRSEFLFHKYAISKKNHFISSSKSGDITDLKSVIF